MPHEDTDITHPLIKVRGIKRRAKITSKLLGCIAEYDYLCIMFEKPTYEELEQVIITLKSRVAYLERML